MDPPGSPSSASALVWRLGDTKSRVLLTVLLSPLVLMAGFTLAAAASGRPYGDFFAMWSFARFALSQPPAGIYDADALIAFQHAMAPGRDYSPFPYPPFYLLFLLPLGFLSVTAAWMLWSSAGLAAWLAAIFAPERRPIAALPFVLLSPATLVALATGQNSLFSAALIVGGLRLMPTRAGLAGVMLGVAAFKPQLGLLIPVALVAARAWRSLATGAATILALAAAATVVLGTDAWPGWLATLGRQWNDYVAQGNITRLKMPTIAAALESVGASQAAALAAQLAALFAAAIAVWVTFRRRKDGLAVAALLAGGFVATPYALLYDLPLATFAILLAVLESDRIGFGWSLGEVAVLVAAYLAPYALFLIDITPFPIAAVALVMLFLVLARRALTTPRQALDVAAQAS